MARAKKLPSGRWRVQAFVGTDADGKKERVSFTADSKKEAEYMAAEFVLNKKDRQNVCQLYLSEAFEDYVAKRESILSPATVREYKRVCKNNLQPLMTVKVSDITQSKVQEVINDESRNHAPKTVRNMHGLLSAVLKAYRPDFVLRTALPEKRRPKIYVPSDEQVKNLIAAISNTELEIPVLLAAFGPMRRGEICALDSDHVNGTQVHVASAMVKNDKNQWLIKQPKSYAGDRMIEFPDFVADKLKDINGRIVTLNPDQISNRFRRLLDSIGMERFRFHDLRHYNASISHALGIPDQYVMLRGGWSSDAVLKAVYRHTMQDKEKRMNNIANEHFKSLFQDNSSHESSHDNKKPT